MAAALDRAAFFAAARAKPFGGSLKQGQVTGMTAILDACPLDLDSDSLAYCLATVFHETDRTMLPIKEYGGEAYFKKMYDPQGARPHVAQTLGNILPGDGAKFAGRGYVQLTGRSNYRRATGELQNRGYLTREQDLTLAPDMAMTPDIAAAIMFLGMSEGWFTGKKLSDYFGPVRIGDPFNARRIINGVDKAEAIKGYHTAFRAALKAAGHVPGATTRAVPTPPVEAGPLFPPAPRKPADPPPPGTGGVSASSSLLSRILSRFSTKA
jgi:putative chitinase